MAYTLGDITSASATPSEFPALTDQTETLVTLSAGQAAGTTPVLAANSNRKLLTLGNPGANVMLVNLVPGAVAGQGLPLAAASVLAFDRNLPCPPNAIYVLGTAGDKLTIWTA